MPKNIKIMVVDDSITYRTILTEILKKIEGVEVVATASNGQAALDKVPTHKPDIITLDINMPIMDGLMTLRLLTRKYPDIGVIMLSTMSPESADQTIKALNIGSIDFIIKPTFSNRQQSTNELTSQLDKILTGFRMNRSRGSVQLPSTNRLLITKQKSATIKRPLSVEVIVIASSTGGPKALERVIPKLPSNLSVPILIVQHMPKLFTRSLAKMLGEKSLVPVQEAVDMAEIKPGNVYIAPGDKHMVVVTGGNNRNFIKLKNDPPENSCRPSADPLFRSVASTYNPQRVLCIVMTGMGSDGQKGVEFIQAKNGGYCLTQSKESCVIYGMPKAINDSGLQHEPVDLEDLASNIASLTKLGSSRALSIGQGFSKQEFKRFISFLEENCGIKLGEEKEYLVHTRLEQVMKKKGINTLTELMVRAKGDRALLGVVVDTMTTNETLWFRNILPFEVLKKYVLPKIVQQNTKPVRIWSSACSSGQEPYSIAMVIHEYLKGKKIGYAIDHFDIRATDISSTALSAARSGMYHNLALSRGLSDHRKHRYFLQTENKWRIKNEISNLITFNQLNLKQSFYNLGKFDIIFCCNVLIYFSDDFKRDILGRMARSLNPNGFLFLGGAETLNRYTELFTPTHTSGGIVYQLKK